MYSDTHFHFQNTVQDDEARGAELLEAMATSKPALALDIGTKADDLATRLSFAERALDAIENTERRAAAERMLFFSAGIWPSLEDIHNRDNALEELESQIEDATAEGERFRKKIIAIGECGIDHHWNPSNPDARSQDDFDAETYNGERELFEMQLNLAKKKNLPVIVHSRDAFSDTLACIKKIGYDKGIIHCFSYGKEEARAFLERGWYLAFGGAVTYTKKSRMYEMEDLLCYVPEDRLLLETDSPYLTPVPLRGERNTPLNIQFTYEFISAKRGISVQQLFRIVDRNCQKLFKL